MSEADRVTEFMTNRVPQLRRCVGRRFPGQQLFHKANTVLITNPAGLIPPSSADCIGSNRSVVEAGLRCHVPIDVYPCGRGGITPKVAVHQISLVAPLAVDEICDDGMELIVISGGRLGRDEIEIDVVSEAKACVG